MNLKEAVHAQDMTINKSLEIERENSLGPEPEWKKCPQCGRENSVETWAKRGNRCPNCNGLFGKD